MREVKTWLLLKPKDLEVIYESQLKYHKTSFEKEILNDSSETSGVNYFLVTFCILFSFCVNKHCHTVSSLSLHSSLYFNFIKNIHNSMNIPCETFSLIHACQATLTNGWGFSLHLFSVAAPLILKVCVMKMDNLCTF